MECPACEYEILRLSEAFYKTYPNPPYKEILKKKGRGYNCLLFQSHYEYFVCIPYRSEINHKYAYKFRNTARACTHKSGLDYTKMVIIDNPIFLCDQNAVIDRDEYKETILNMEKIKKNALEFLEDYIQHRKGIQCLNQKEFNRRYLYSPLPYFESILGI